MIKFAKEKKSKKSRKTINQILLPSINKMKSRKI